MVGAMIMARVSDDPALSNEVLEETRAWIEDSRLDRHFLPDSIEYGPRCEWRGMGSCQEISVARAAFRHSM